MMRQALLLAAVVSLTPVAAQAQLRQVGVPAVWDSNHAQDAGIAAELTIALRGTVSTVPGWTLASLDVTLADLMRACNGAVEYASGQCLTRLAAAHAPVIANGLVVFAAIMRTDESDPNSLVLTLALHDVTTGESRGQLTVSVGRETAMAERVRLAGEWLLRLSSPEAAPPPDPPDMAVSPPPEPDTVPVIPTEPVPSVAHGGGFDLEYVAWPLIGLGLAAFAAEGYVWFRLGEIQNDPDFVAYRSGFGMGTSNTCDQPSDGSLLGMRGHSLCSEGDTLELLEWILLGVGGASLIGGTVLLLADLGGSSTEEHSLLIRPTVSSTQARLDVSFTF